MLNTGHGPDKQVYLRVLDTSRGLAVQLKHSVAWFWFNGQGPDERYGSKLGMRDTVPICKYIFICIKLRGEQPRKAIEAMHRIVQRNGHGPDAGNANPQR